MFFSRSITITDSCNLVDVTECSERHPCEGLSRHAHFRNFGIAFLTLFRVATGDNWNGIMKVRGLRLAIHIVIKLSVVMCSCCSRTSRELIDVYIHDFFVVQTPVSQTASSHH